ncbi:hypothetical protein THAOC_32415 [Thalassiosira oceanica]|uniref:Uncharacterized protein n=1 Tax=Thalassiosira oceanica TaxID=159749 RepID=K0R9A6_THAOC|nr:hypothetical protein THAOC_32415 [Thalassiosira oceanica]|eukprot:EJK48759.1 hypothetical protein THAOC_32415 [Thalassiosira oceanica]
MSLVGRQALSVRWDGRSKATLPALREGENTASEVEMVLLNGQHVKFGPVEWEDASSDGFIVPKTTSVGGMCRLNPEEPDESLWEWADCPEGAGVDFDDLWYAANGGGGGTWGVAPLPPASTVRHRQDEPGCPLRDCERVRPRR